MLRVVGIPGKAQDQEKESQEYFIYTGMFNQAPITVNTDQAKRHQNNAAKEPVIRHCR